MLADQVSVAILGCGQIGSRWDMPGSAAHGGPTLTHAAAFTRQDGAQLVGFCDADLAKAQEAVMAWRTGQAFADLPAMLQATRPDVLVIAAHSSVRLAAIEQALAAGVTTLVIEKPLAPTLAEGRQVVRALAESGGRSLVNYLRHWDPSLDELRQRIASGSLGRVQRLVGTYGKGVSNSGSHMIDLASLLCGATPVAARGWAPPLPATESAWSQGADPCVDGQVRLTDAQGQDVMLDLLSTDTQAFTCFELRIIGTQALCEIRLGGRRLEWQTIIDDPHFAGYRIPGERQDLPARNLEAMDAMASEALALARGAISRARCDALHALTTAATVHTLRQSADAGQSAWISIEV